MAFISFLLLTKIRTTQEISATWEYANFGDYGYSLQGIRISNDTKINSINFYDQYDFLDQSGFAELTYSTPENGYDSRHTFSNKGLLAGTYIAEAGSGSTVLRSALYYDYRKRLVQSKSTNHIGGKEYEYIGYNFSGQPLKRMHTHTADGDRPSQTEYYTYTYDHAGRLQETKHKLNTGSEYSLAQHTYNELGQLEKTVRNGRTDLTESFTYNVRSWTKGIDGVQFKENLEYSPNGNISMMDWAMDAQKRVYSFTYDNLSRIKAAGYAGIGNEKYSTSYTYDKMGNIRTLQKNGKTAIGSYGIVDNLALIYAGNQLTNVTESAGNISLPGSNDFKKYTAANQEYTYNLNGALAKDLCKGISSISYNLLSLPEQMDIKSPVAEARNTYTYAADGRKLKVVQQWNNNYSTHPVIGTLIDTSSLNNTQTIEYVGNMIYEGTGTNATSLKRILIDGGYIEGDVYHFYFRDHLGNNRAVVSATGNVIQRSHYYPFGTTFAETSSTDQNVQPYQYNGKELDRMHRMNLYDYEARYMEPALGRFTTMDPLAEKYYSTSPYAYCGNNPLRFIDIEGKFKMDANQIGLYPRLAEYLKNTIQEIANNPKIMSGLMIFGDLSKKAIINDLKWGQGPSINVSSVPNAYGKFNQETKALEICKDYVEMLEKATGEEREALLFLIAVTILHEYVHYGDYQSGDRYIGEEGEDFEKATYGKIIGKDNSKSFINQWIKKQEEARAKKEGIRQIEYNIDNMEEGTYVWDRKTWVKTLW